MNRRGLTEVIKRTIQPLWRLRDEPDLLAGQETAAADEVVEEEEEAAREGPRLRTWAEHC